MKREALGVGGEGGKLRKWRSQCLSAERLDSKAGRSSGGLVAPNGPSDAGRQREAVHG